MPFSRVNYIRTFSTCHGLPTRTISCCTLSKWVNGTLKMFVCKRRWKRFSRLPVSSVEEVVVTLCPHVVMPNHSSHVIIGTSLVSFHVMTVHQLIRGSHPGGEHPQNQPCEVLFVELHKVDSISGRTSYSRLGKKFAFLSRSGVLLPCHV